MKDLPGLAHATTNDLGHFLTGNVTLSVVQQHLDLVNALSIFLKSRS